MSEEINNEFFLRPRFKFIHNESREVVIEKFASNLEDNNCKYCSKLVDGHIVIDVPKEEAHFWSPQLHIEIEEETKEKAVVKGLFGPKPQVWTLFMFFHFAVAVAFIGFAITLYVQWTLKTDVTFSLYMLLAMPIIWILMYVIGRLGKKTGQTQMEELHDFMKKTLSK